MSYSDYHNIRPNSFAAFTNYAYVETDDVNTMNCLNLRDSAACADCLKVQDTDHSGMYKNMHLHEMLHQDFVDGVCTQPYLQVVGDGIGFTFPPVIGTDEPDPEAAAQYDNTPRRYCTIPEHRRITSCLQTASGDDKTECVTQCTPDPWLHFPTGPPPTSWPDTKLPVCVPYTDTQIDELNTNKRTTDPTWINLEYIDDNFMQTIVEGCQDQSGYDFVYDQNRHLCTSKYKIGTPCDEIDMSTLDRALTCNDLAYSSNPVDNPDNPYTICEPSATRDGSCTTKRNTDGTVAVCSNHLRSCTRDEWDERVESEGAAAIEQVWCYAQAPLAGPTTCETHPPVHCRPGEILDPQKNDNLCTGADGRCTYDDCCSSPQCSWGFKGVCPSYSIRRNVENDNDTICNRPGLRPPPGGDPYANPCDICACCDDNPDEDPTKYTQDLCGMLYPGKNVKPECGKIYSRAEQAWCKTKPGQMMCAVATSQDQESKCRDKPEYIDENQVEILGCPGCAGPGTTCFTKLEDPSNYPICSAIRDGLQEVNSCDSIIILGKKNLEERRVFCEKYSTAHQVPGGSVPGSICSAHATENKCVDSGCMCR